MCDFALVDKTVEGSIQCLFRNDCTSHITFLTGAGIGTVFQFERIGFFVIDIDYKPNKVCLFAALIERLALML